MSGKLAIFAVLLVVVPAATYGFLQAFENPYAVVADEFLVRHQFAGQVRNPDVWQELLRRLRSGRLSKSEALIAMETLILRLNNVSVHNRTNVWGNRFGFGLGWPDVFIKEVHEKYPLKPQHIESILDAYHGRPEVTAEQVEGGGPTEQLVTLKCQYGCGHTPQLELLLSWTPQVYVDGQPAEIVTMPGESPTDPTMRLAKPGEHLVRVDFVSGYSTDMHGGYTVNWKDAPSSWKLGKGHKLRTISVNLKVKVDE